MPRQWLDVEDLPNASDSDLAREAIASASHLPWAMSGRKYSGLQTVEETYECACKSVCGASASTYTAVSLPGSGMANVPRGMCRPGGHRLRLRGRPVLAVHKVVSDSGELSQGAYSVLGRHTLVVHSGAPCTLTMSYTFGQQVPAAGRIAARKLAGEFVKLWTDSEECQLPDRVTSISRQGVSYTILDNQDFLADLRTGIYEVDLFLKVVNPDNARKPARVLTPDMPRLTRARRLAAPPVPEPVIVDPTGHDIVIRPGVISRWVVQLQTVANLAVDFADWVAVGQIVDQYGTPLMDLGPEHFTYHANDKTLHGYLSAQQAQSLTLVGLHRGTSMPEMMSLAVAH